MVKTLWSTVGMIMSLATHVRLSDVWKNLRAWIGHLIQKEDKVTIRAL